MGGAEVVRQVFLDLTAASVLDSFGQLAALLRDPLCYGANVARGDGAPVLLIPGFFAGDWAMTTMALWLRRLGYRPYSSGIDLNLGCPRDRIERLQWRLEGIVRENDAPAALIGHSLGGVMARALASRAPELTSHVIAIGAPFQNDWASLNRRLRPVMQSVAGLWQNLVGAPDLCGTTRCGCGFATYRPLRDRNKFTSIYSREDEIVDWRACIEPGGRNFEIRGRHLGMLVNREAYRLIAQILAAEARRPEESKTDPGKPPTLAEVGG
jgi:pimeloyl-ACP methyl ester carboxylesterase